MARMFTNSIYYVHEKSGMAELNKDIPVAQPKSNNRKKQQPMLFFLTCLFIVQADEPQVFQGNALQVFFFSSGWHKNQIQRICAN